jgi:hypothetical protein
MALARFASGKDERFTYEYNFFAGWVIDVRFDTFGGARLRAATRCHRRTTEVRRTESAESE